MYYILYFFRVKIYFFEQYFNRIAANQLNTFSLYTTLLIFSSGLLSSINPCNLSVFPIAATYTIKTQINYKQPFTITIGIVSSFLLTIIIIGLFNASYKPIKLIAPIFLSIYMVVIGLSLLQIIQLNVFHFLKNSSDTYTKYKFFNDYTLGFLLGINTSSCSTPILAVIILWISNSQDITLVILYTIFYIIGYSLPVIILLFLINSYSRYITQFKSLWNYITLASGCIILTFGILSFINNFTI